MSNDYFGKADAAVSFNESRLDNISLVMVQAPVVYSDASVKLADLGVGDVVFRVWAEVTTAFNAGTTNVLKLGNGATSNKFLDTADVTETATGVTPSGGKGPFTAETAASALTATFAQTGTAATAGAARVYALIAKAGS
jgi:hypothetical protein